MNPFGKRRERSAPTPVIRSVAADITALDVEVIVNAANSQLAAGGGVCGAIFSAAGHRLLQAACDQIGHCPTGSAVATPAFSLSARGVHHIIHAVGPVWDARTPEKCDDLLVSAYRSALKLAESLGARSIAVPGISTGIYGFPIERAAARVAELLTTEVFDLDEITLVTLKDDGARVYADALEGARRRNVSG